MDLEKNSCIPLRQIDQLLHDAYFLDWIENFNDRYFDQYLQYEDYIGECLRIELYQLIEQSISTLWIEITDAYWDEKTNSGKVRFYGHRMLVILERVNLSNMLYPYFDLVKGMFLDFEHRIKHHLNYSLEFSSRIETNKYFKLDKSQRSFYQEISPINGLEPVIKFTSKITKEKRPRDYEISLKLGSDAKRKYSTDYKKALNECLIFLNPEKSHSNLTMNQFMSLSLILEEILDTQLPTTTNKRFRNAINSKITQKRITKEFAQLMEKLSPRDRPRWFIDSIWLIFDYGGTKTTLYKHWSDDLTLPNNRL